MALPKREEMPCVKELAWNSYIIVTVLISFDLCFLESLKKKKTVMPRISGEL